MVYGAGWAVGVERTGDPDDRMCLWKVFSTAKPASFQPNGSLTLRTTGGTATTSTPGMRMGLPDIRISRSTTSSLSIQRAGMGRFMDGAGKICNAGNLFRESIYGSCL